MGYLVSPSNVEGVSGKGTISLSPLLFVLAADLLQSIINKACNLNLLKHPPSKDFGQDYPIIQYVDDTLLILLAEAFQLFTIKGPLRRFADASGPKGKL
jgi:hypothetical protein